MHIPTATATARPQGAAHDRVLSALQQPRGTRPYGGAAGFEEVLGLAEDACEGLLLYVRMQLPWQAQTGAQAAAPRWPG